MVRETSIVRRPTSGVCRPATQYLPLARLLLGTLLSAVIGVVVCIPVRANDSEFFGAGSTLLPVKNTSIRMQREDLRITYRNDTAYIDVEYVFVNEKSPTTITVGFVSPPPSKERHLEEWQIHQFAPPIAHFEAIVNGVSVPYSVRHVSDVTKRPKAHTYPFDYIFLFKARFGKGQTRISHRYRFRASGHVGANRIIPYRLLTGTHWKGGVIDTFHLTVDCGPNTLVGVPTTFTADSAHTVLWKVNGIASNADSVGYHEQFEDEPVQPFQVFAIERGTLELTQYRFTPSQDLSVEIHLGYSLIEKLRWDDQSWIATLSCVELRHIDEWFTEYDDEIDDVDRSIIEATKELLKNCSPTAR